LCYAKLMKWFFGIIIKTKCSSSQEEDEGTTLSRTLIMCSVVSLSLFLWLLVVQFRTDRCDHSIVKARKWAALGYWLRWLNENCVNLRLVHRSSSELVASWVFRTYSALGNGNLSGSLIEHEQISEILFDVMHLG